MDILAASEMPVDSVAMVPRETRVRTTARRKLALEAEVLPNRLYACLRGAADFAVDISVRLPASMVRRSCGTRASTNYFSSEAT